MSAVELAPSVQMSDAQFLASEIDRCWFLANAGRSYRIRPAIDGELPDVRAGDYMVVRQVASGARVRVGFSTATPLPPEEASEQIAKAMFDRVMGNRGIARRGSEA